MKLLVVALGSIGRLHAANARALRPDAELIAWRRPTRDRGHDALVDRVVTSAADAIAAAPDLAIVANPAPFHIEAARVLLEAGVPVMVEKPLATTPEEVDPVLALAEARGLPLLVAYPFRFHAGICRLRAAVADGAAGAVRHVRTEVGQWLPDWRPTSPYPGTVSARAELGGGALLELSHEIDTALWLAGAPVTSVAARTAQPAELEVDVETLAELWLTFGDGALGSVHVDMLQRAPRRAARVIGSEATLEWSMATNAVTRATRDGVETLYAGGPEERDAMYVEQLRHFLACVESGEAPRVTGADGRRVLEVIAAARHAAAAGQEVAL